MINNIIFDWNGTLMDDTLFTMNIENEMLAKRGMKTLTLEKYKEWFDFPVINYYVKMGYDFTKEPYEKLSVEFMDMYLSRYKECPLVPGTAEMLKSLKNRGKKMVVLSASQEDYLRRQIENYGITGYFDELLGLDDIHAVSKVERGKNWIAKSGLNPRETVMLGDSVHDYETASGMGVRCVLTSTGHQSKERLLKTGAPVVNSHREFLRLIDKM